MPELPALPFNRPTIGQRTTRPATRPPVEGPGPDVQSKRLGPALQRLTTAFEAQRVAVAAGDDAFAPEQVLVLEIAGEIEDFAAAVQKIPGLEFLAEELGERVAPDEFAAVDPDGRRGRYARQVFLVLSDETAWRQLLSLWERFQRGERFVRGTTKFRHLFELLRGLRAWDNSDRLERTGAVDVWAREFADIGDEMVEFEVELWLRRELSRRTAASAALREDLEAVGGEFVGEYINEEIDYHGVLGKVPASRLREAVDDHEMRWLRTTGVRFFHAVGQMAATAGSLDLDPEPIEASDEPTTGDARVAVLDGLPLAGHASLRGRIIVDDPEGWEATIPAARRIHGTGMASVVIHGDLNGSDTPLSAPVYVRPVLAPHVPDWVPNATEELPRDRLPVDVLHTAVARLFEGDQAAAPNVRAVLLAVGDVAQQFDRFVSPLARLLDWLSFRHQVLFIVSAGNHLDPLLLPADLDVDNSDEIQHELLCAVGRSAPVRRLLAPAESINALTIGAAHADESGAIPTDDRIEPVAVPDLPSIVSAIGGGVRRAVKPDILMDGGRQLVRIEPANEDGSRLATLPLTYRRPGVRVAAPSSDAGRLDATVHSNGTSVAAAMAAHHAGRLVEVLDWLRGLHDERMPGPGLDAVILKAALVHSARWGGARALVDDMHADIGQRRSRALAGKLLGYGRSTPDRSLICDDHRVTVLGGGTIGKDGEHTYRFPLPSSLASRTTNRRITLTLAWLTPVNPQNRFYRRAALKLVPGGQAKALASRIEADSNDACRGTLQHEVLEGGQAVPYAPGAAIELAVTCREDAGPLEVALPYAIMASVEVPQEVGLPIYEEVRQALHVPVGVRTAVRV